MSNKITKIDKTVSDIVANIPDTLTTKIVVNTAKDMMILFDKMSKGVELVKQFELGRLFNNAVLDSRKENSKVSVKDIYTQLNIPERTFYVYITNYAVSKEIADFNGHKQVIPVPQIVVGELRGTTTTDKVEHYRLIQAVHGDKPDQKTLRSFNKQLKKIVSSGNKDVWEVTPEEVQEFVQKEDDYKQTIAATMDIDIEEVNRAYVEIDALANADAIWEVNPAQVVETIKAFLTPKVAPKVAPKVGYGIKGKVSVRLIFSKLTGDCPATGASPSVTGPKVMNELSSIDGDEWKRLYRKLADLLHPDKKGATEDMTILNAINNAMNTIYTEGKKSESAEAWEDDYKQWKKDRGYENDFVPENQIK